MPPVYVPGTIANDQGHHIFRADLDRYTILGEGREGNRAQHFVWRDAPRQQILCLDRRNHEFSWGGIVGGAYPTNYEVCRSRLVGCFVGTGGKPLFTHRVCAEYMVGSETKYPAWTHWVHFDRFCNLPPICPLKYPPGTC